MLLLLMLLTDHLSSGIFFREAYLEEATRIEDMVRGQKTDVLWSFRLDS